MYAQITCSIDDEVFSQAPLDMKEALCGCDQFENFVPNVICNDDETPSHRPIITVYLNYHFIQNALGEDNFGYIGGSNNGLGINYPQNYNCTPELLPPGEGNYEDEYGNTIEYDIPESFNAYHIAERLTRGMNWKLRNNQPNAIWEDADCVKTQVQFEIYKDKNNPIDSGVYVHQQATNEYAATWVGDLKTNLSVNGDKVIDIFFTEDNTIGERFDMGGRTSRPNRVIEIGNMWKNVLYSKCDPEAPEPTSINRYYGLILHEIGHILLNEGNEGHSFNCPRCSLIAANPSPMADIDAVQECNSGTYQDQSLNWHNDGVGCPNDPAINPCYDLLGCNVGLGNGCCCNEKAPNPNFLDSNGQAVKSNNIMGYNGRNSSFTPCQLALIHFNFYDDSQPKRTAPYVKKD